MSEADDFGPPVPVADDQDFGPPVPVRQPSNDEVTARLRASILSNDTNPALARNALQLSYKSGLGPDAVAQDLPAIQSRYKTEGVIDQLVQMPRVARLMAQSGVHAAALKDETDTLGILAWVFGDKIGPGRPVTPADEPYVPRSYFDTPDVNPMRPRMIPEMSPPGWLLSAGRASYGVMSHLQTWLEERSPGGSRVNMARIRYDNELMSMPLPGEGKSLASRVLYAASDSTPLMLAASLGPGAVFGLLYSEGTGSIYEGLRLSGHSHEDSAQIADVAGFAGAAAATFTGQRLFGALIPKSLIGESQGIITGTLLKASMDRPAFWKFLLDVGKNQLHATFANIAAAVTQATLVETYQAAKEGRRASPWVTADAGRRAAQGSIDLLPFSVYSALGQGRVRREGYMDLAPLREFQEHLKSADALADQRLFDVYEEQGHALNSLKDAGDINAAIEAVSRSKLFKDNPELGKKIIGNLQLPRRMQTVFFDPEKLLALPEADLDTLNPGDAASAVQTGTKVPVSMQDFLTSEAGQKLAKDATLSPTGSTAKEAAKPAAEIGKLLAMKSWIEQTEPYSPERQAKIDSIMEQLRGAAYRAAMARGAEEPPSARTVRFYHGGVPYTGGPRWLTPDRAYAEGYASRSPSAKVHYVDIPENHPLLEKAFDDSGTSQTAPYRAFEAPEDLAKHLRPVSEPSAGQAPPQEPPKSPPAAGGAPPSPGDPNWRFYEEPEGPQEPTTKAAYKLWAEDAVSARTIGELPGMVKAHGRAARRALNQVIGEHERAINELSKAEETAQQGIDLGVKSGLQGRRAQAIEAAANLTEKEVEWQKGVRPKPLSPDALPDTAEGGLYDTGTPTGEPQVDPRLILRGQRAGVRGELGESRTAQQGAEDKSVRATERTVKAGESEIKAQDQEHLAKANEAMATAAMKAHKESDKIANLVDARATAEVRRDTYAAHFDYGEAHDAILEALGKPQRGSAAPDVADAYERMRMDGYDGLATDFDVSFLNKLISNPRPLEDMTLAEARKVQSALKTFELIADAEGNLQFIEGRVDISNAKAQIGDHLRRLPERRPGQRGLPDNPQAIGLKNRVLAGLAHLGSEANQPQTLFFKMGPMGDKIWFDDFIGARNKEERYHAEVEPALKAIRESIPKEVSDSAGDSVPPVPGMPGMRVRSDVWRLAQLVGTVDGMDKISRGLGVQPAELARYIQDNLGRTSEHATTVMEKMIEPTWRVFDGIWEKYHDQFRARGLPPPKTLEAGTVRVNGKDYKGGYGGRLRWLNDLESRPQVEEGSVASLYGRDYYDPSTPQQFLQERTGKAGLPDLNWEGVDGSIRAELHNLAFDPFVEKTHKLLSDPDLRGLLNSKLGEQYVNQLYDPKDENSWLHTVARGKVQDINAAPAWNRAIRNLQGRAAMSAFNANLRVVAGQFSHIPAMAFGLGISPIDMANGILKAQDPVRRNWAHLNSEILPYRDNDFERKNTELVRDLTGVMPGEGIETAIPGVARGQRVTNTINWAIWRQMDAFLSHAIWEAAYSKATSGGLTGLQMTDLAEAKRYADKAVSRAMPVQSIYEQSAFVRDRNIGGLLFLVRNFPNTLYNVGALNAWNARLTDGGPVRRYGAQVGSAISYIGMTASAEIFGRWMMGHGPKDEDADAYLARSMVRSLTYPTQVGDIAEGAYQGVMGNRREAKFLLERASPVMGVTSKALLDIGNAVNKNDEEALRAALEAAGIGVKLPLARYYDLLQGAATGDPAAGLGYKQ